MLESILPKLDDFDTSAIGPIKGTHGQQIIDALRKLDHAQGYDSSKPHPYWDFLETWPAIVVGLNAPGYQSELNPPKPIGSMYWVQKCYVGDGQTADPVNFYPAQDDPTQYYPATNVLEMTAPPNVSGTNQVQMGQPVLIMVYVDRGVTNRKRYLFIADRPVAWIKLTSIMPSSGVSQPINGGGFYNASLVTGAPITIDPVNTDLIAPISPNETVGPDNAILAMNWAESDQLDPPSHWVPLIQFVPAWLIGYSNETAASTPPGPRPVYRFFYPIPGPRDGQITEALGTPGANGGARYKFAISYGNAVDLNVTASNFMGTDAQITYNPPASPVAISYWINVFEGGTGQAGTCVLDVGTFVRGSYVGTASDGLAVYYGSSAPTGTCFKVLLTVASSHNTSPLFQYSVTTLGGLPLTPSGSFLAPDMRPTGGGSNPATQGIGYLDQNGAFHLLYADEQKVVAFPVTLTTDGGMDGTPTTAATWTYTVKDLLGNTLGTTVAVDTPRFANGTMTPATKGQAYYNGTTLVLEIAFEVHGTATCS